MKVLVLLALFVICVSAKTLSLEEEWKNFKAHHGKSYRSILDEKRRFSIFRENLRKIEEHNALYEQGLKSYKLGVTKFADLSKEEFRKFLTLKTTKKSPSIKRTLFKVPDNADIPESMDWRDEGAVTPVKDQGQCGACWAFSVTGSVEGQYFLAGNNLTSFSEQQMIDCSSNEEYYTDGCDGGNLDGAFSYVEANGLEPESDYPFEEYDDTCRFNANLVTTKISSHVDVETLDEEALKAAVGLVGPVSVALDADNFQLYKEGIYDEKCSQEDLNHAVLAVGYGTSEEGHKYWILKNSWGVGFGQDGYLLMKRGVNQCGIAVEPSYPQM